MKKILFLISLVFGMFFVGNHTVLAEDGPIIIQAIVENDDQPEITVMLADEQYKPTGKTYTLNKDNYWIQKDTVPVGKYKILPHVAELQGVNLDRFKYDESTLEVVANPSVTEDKDERPRFNMILGGIDYVKKYSTMIYYPRLNGTKIYGVNSAEDMERYYKESVNRQAAATTVRKNDLGDPYHHVHDHEHGADEDHHHDESHGTKKNEDDDIDYNKLHKEFKEQTKGKETFNSLKEDKSPIKKWMVVSGVVVLVAIVGGVAFWYFKIR